MQQIARLTFGVLLVAACAGCTSYHHARYDGSGAMIEETSLRAPFLTKTAIAGLKTHVSDKHGTNGTALYIRNVGLESAAGTTDAEGIDALNRLIGQAILSGLKMPQPAP